MLQDMQDIQMQHRTPAYDAAIEKRTAERLTWKFLPLKSPLTSSGNCIPVTVTFAPWVRDTSCFLTSAKTLLPSPLWISTVSCMVSSLLVRVATGCPFLSQSTFLCRQSSCYMRGIKICCMLRTQHQRHSDWYRKPYLTHRHVCAPQLEGRIPIGISNIKGVSHTEDLRSMVIISWHAIHTCS